jgi:hypothetical protein
MSIEVLAVCIGALNGFILLVKPVGRLHTRLDLIEYRLADIEKSIARLTGQSYSKDTAEY